MRPDPRDNSSGLLGFDGRLVTLVVGAEKKKITVHLSHLSRASSFFKAAFAKEWKEGQESRITLADEEPAVVDVYVHFVYSGKLAVRGESSDAEYLLLSKMYCFGTKHQDDPLCDAVIDAIIAKSQVKIPEDSNKRHFPKSADLIDFVWTNTSFDSPVQKLIVDMYVHDGNETWLSNGSTSFEFFADLTKALFGVRKDCFGCMSFVNNSGPSSRNPRWDSNAKRWVYMPSRYYVKPYTEDERTEMRLPYSDDEPGEMRLEPDRWLCLPDRHTGVETWPRLPIPPAVP